MVPNKLLTLLFIVGLVDARVLRNEIHNLLSDDEVEKVFGTLRTEVPEYDVVHPVKLDNAGEFLSDDVSHDDANPQHNLNVGLSAFGKRYHIKLTSNTDQLLAPNFVTEIRNNGHSRYDRSVDDCHYIGHLVTTQGPGNKVALSSCDGLSGIIQTDNEVLMISPLPKRLGLAKPSHVVFRRTYDDVSKIKRTLGMDVRKGKQSQPDDNDETQEDVSSGTYYIETLLVTDKEMVKYHGNVAQLKKYVLTLVNIVQSLIGDPSIGADIKYVLNRLEILETDEPGLHIKTHAQNTLSSFCKWATQKKNNLVDSDKAYFDHASLITRLPLCAKSYDPSSLNCNSLLGLADLGGMCGYQTSCVLSTDSGLGTAFTIAHETGHNLDAEHDGENNRCPDGVNIMARKASGKPTGYEWSSCSRTSITGFLRNKKSKCLRDAPGQSVVPPTSLPGQEYSLNDQCKLMVKGSSGFCNQPGNLAKACSVLWCVKGKQCETINEPAVEGSPCGYKKFCKRGMCVPLSDFGKNGPKPVDGGFSSWSTWGTCSRSCGGSVRVRRRRCDNPTPKNFGKPCNGKSEDFEYCFIEKCPSSTPDPRKAECESKWSVPFEGGITYQWVYNPKQKVDANKRCNLTCVAPGGSFYTFKSAVQNGLSCHGNGPRGACINGECKVLGCDNVIESKAKLDVCGVCKGDGSTCIKKHGTFNKKPDDAPDFQTIAMIPKGSTGILIEEKTPSTNDLALKTKSNKEILNMYNNVLSTSDAYVPGAGTTFNYTISGNQQKITSKGPLNESIIIQFYVADVDTLYNVYYEYHIPSKASSRDASQDSTEQFKWVTTGQACSVTCGGGKRFVTVDCVRVDDGSPVSPDNCHGEEPKGLSEECNTQTCPARWNVYGWSECSKTCNDGTLGHQSRQVTCVFDSNGVEELLDDSDCKGPKPAAVRPCGHQGCPRVES